MSSTFGRGVTGRRLCEDVGTRRGGGLLTASARPEDAPLVLKLLERCDPQTEKVKMGSSAARSSPSTLCPSPAITFLSFFLSIQLPFFSFLIRGRFPPPSLLLPPFCLSLSACPFVFIPHIMEGNQILVLSKDVIRAPRRILHSGEVEVKKRTNDQSSISIKCAENTVAA